MNAMQPHERIILPLDVSDIEKAHRLVKMLAPLVGMFKVGFEAIYSTMAQLFTASPGEAEIVLEDIRNLAKMITPQRVFLDVKLADIPNTVGAAVKALSTLKVKMINVHASAGKDVIRTAAMNKGGSLLFGVTVLTSIDTKECFSIFGADPGPKVLHLADLLMENGADGIICAPKDGLLLRRYPRLSKLTIACPNIRPEWAATKEERERVKDDQSVERQMTPGEAIKAGIDMLVIGRPITKPPAEIGTPADAAKLIAQEIARAT